MTAHEEHDGADRAEQARPAAGAEEQTRSASDDVRADQGGEPQAELADEHADGDSADVPAEVEQAREYLREHGSDSHDPEEGSK